MKLLFVHNTYRYGGGEDQVFQRECALLRSAGHRVLEYTRDNREIETDGFLNKTKLGLRTLWARDTHKELRTILQRERPQLVHFHNTFPLISPAAYYACHEAGIPVVQSLHNARLMCPAATFYREGRICQDCLGKTLPWPGVVHACYRNSSLCTATVAGMLTLHRLLGTWQQRVDAYIVFSEFFRKKFISAGLPACKIHIKPHFLGEDPGMKNGIGDYALFIGRLAPEKGVATLLRAWESLSQIPLVVRGEGPMEGEVKAIADNNPSIRVAAYLTKQECFDLIKGARFLVWPSEGYYETFGLVAIEAFACGTPVISSGLGAMAEIVEDGKTGLHFEGGNAKDLAAKVAWAWKNPKQIKNMGEMARTEYENKYTAERNYPLLMQIYERACRAISLENDRETASVACQVC